MNTQLTAEQFSLKAAELREAKTKADCEARVIRDAKIVELAKIIRETDPCYESARQLLYDIYEEYERAIRKAKRAQKEAHDELASQFYGWPGHNA